MCISVALERKINDPLYGIVKCMVFEAINNNHGL